MKYSSKSFNFRIVLFVCINILKLEYHIVPFRTTNSNIDLLAPYSKLYV